MFFILIECHFLAFKNTCIILTHLFWFMVFLFCQTMSSFIWNRFMICHLSATCPIRFQVRSLESCKTVSSERVKIMLPQMIFFPVGAKNLRILKHSFLQQLSKIKPCTSDHHATSKFHCCDCLRYVYLQQTWPLLLLLLLLLPASLLNSCLLWRVVTNPNLN